MKKCSNFFKLVYFRGQKMRELSPDLSPLAVNLKLLDGHSHFFIFESTARERRMYISKKNTSHRTIAAQNAPQNEIYPKRYQSTKGTISTTVIFIGESPPPGRLQPCLMSLAVTGKWPSRSFRR